MVVLFSTTIITCYQALGLIQRLQQVIGLSYQQKIEIMQEIRKVIPNCPVKIVEKKIK